MQRIREKLGWTQAQMGAYLGLAGPSVSRIEHGQRPRPATEKLLDMLEVERAAAKRATKRAAKVAEVGA